MVESVDIMIDDMTYIGGTFEESVPSSENTSIENEGMSNDMFLGLVIGGCIIIGVVLGIILGRKAARK